MVPETGSESNFEQRVVEEKVNTFEKLIAELERIEKISQGWGGAPELKKKGVWILQHDAMLVAGRSGVFYDKNLSDLRLYHLSDWSNMLDYLELVTGIDARVSTDALVVALYALLTYGDARDRDDLLAPVLDGTYAHGNMRGVDGAVEPRIKQPLTRREEYTVRALLSRNPLQGMTGEKVVDFVYDNFNHNMDLSTLTAVFRALAGKGIVIENSRGGRIFYS